MEGLEHVQNVTTWVLEQSHRQEGYARPVPPLHFIAFMYHFMTSISMVNLEQAVEAQDKSEGDTLTGPDLSVHVT